jgi:hypothetical protein
MQLEKKQFHQSRKKVSNFTEYQKHSNPDSFKDDDEALIGKIGNLNDEIDSINSTRSPPFSLDLLRASKYCELFA